jgi:hypothetical protein
VDFVNALLLKTLEPPKSSNRRLVRMHAGKPVSFVKN